MNQTRHRGDKFRPVVTVLKTKNGVPTVISIGGQVYIWQSPDQFKGGKPAKEERQR